MKINDVFGRLMLFRQLAATRHHSARKVALMADLDAQIAQVREASRHTVRQMGFMESSYRESQCSHSQCHILLELDLRGCVTMRELSEILNQDKSTTSRVVRSLIKQGHVLATTDCQDGRCKPLTLTASGKEKAGQINQLANDQVKSALALLDEAQRNTVIEGISLYGKALERSRKLGTITIRPITAEDNEAMGVVIRQVMTEFGAVGCGFSIGDPEVDSMAEAYADDRSRYFVALKEDQIIGGAGFGQLAGTANQTVCELRKMYVLPEGRGLGLGRKLMDLCLDAARARGYERMYLETLDNMVRARHLYDKYGFERLDTSLGDTGHSGCNRWAIREL